jgi:hypothetical protein
MALRKRSNGNDAMMTMIGVKKKDQLSNPLIALRAR